MGNVRYLIVPGVTIRHQIAGKAPKEVRGLFSAAIRLVLKDSDGLFASFPAGVYPHPGLRSCRFSILFQYLHSCLIRVNYGVFQQGHLHMPVQRLQSGLGTLDHPVGQCGTAQLHTLSGPDLFLPDHRQSVHILLGHDISHGGGRSQRMLHQGGRRLNSQDVGITSGLFTLVTGVGTAVILQDFFLLRNNDQFPAKQLFTNEPERTTTLAAVQLGFWQLEHDFFYGEVFYQLSNGALFLARVGLYREGFLCRFFCLVVLYKSFGFSLRIAVRCSIFKPSISHRKLWWSMSRSSASDRGH